MTQQLKTAPPTTYRRMTYAQFLEWDGENQHVEWVEGEVVPMAPVGDLHQDFGRWLIALLSYFVDAKRLGSIRYEPFQMKTAPDLPGRSADILFVARKNEHRLKKNHLEGPADLVIEIVSPQSATIDRQDKYQEYERGGVKEYWIIDPEHRRADFYRLGRDGNFHAIALDGHVFRSLVLKGLWLDVRWLWSRPLPAIPDVIRQWGL